jgi:tetratricopeptide (TPR) repeat protein
MSTFKATVKGSLEFGNQKSYDMMMAHLQKRVESYYKNDFLLKEPTLFSEETLSVVVPRIMFQCSEKTWKNTVFLLRELRSFAVAGELYVWVFDDKNVMCCDELIVPQGDKVATTEYLRGIEMLKKADSEDLAVEIFSKAIEKFPRYFQAYARRGMAYLSMNRIEDAIIDFSQSIRLFKNSEAYLGRAQAKEKMNDLEGALVDYQTAIDNAAPYQPVFWTARRLKGECHLNSGDLDKAIFELKLVSKRHFKEVDPNFVYRKQAWKLYGEALLNKGQNAEAAAAFSEALLIENCAVVKSLLSRVKDIPTVGGSKKKMAQPTLN